MSKCCANVHLSHSSQHYSLAASKINNSEYDFITSFRYIVRGHVQVLLTSFSKISFLNANVKCVSDLIEFQLFIYVK